MGSLAVILLILIVIFSVTLLVGDEFAEKVCTNDGASFNAGECYTDSNYNVSSRSEAFNATKDLMTEITTVVGFIGLVVLTVIGAILIGLARSFMRESEE